VTQHIHPSKHLVEPNLVTKPAEQRNTRLASSVYPMANIARTSHSSSHSLQLHSFLPHREVSFNIAFFNARNYFQQNQFTTANSFHYIFAFIVPALLIFLELMYQGKDCTPFDTNPVTMWTSLSCLLAYCLTYWVGEMTYVRLFWSQRYVTAVRCSIVLFGLLSSASLASIFFPDIIKPFLYVLCILISMGELLYAPFGTLWKWIQVRLLGVSDTQERQEGQASADVHWLVSTSTDRRNRLPV